MLHPQLSSATALHRTTLQNWLIQVHPLAKIAAGLMLSISAFVLQNSWALGMLAIVLLVLFLGSVRIKVQIWFSILLFGLLFTGITAWAMNNVAAALLNMLRLGALLLPSPLLAFNTSPTDLIKALQMLRLPSPLLLSLMLFWRFFPVIQQESQRIMEANQLRGVDLKRQPKQWFPGLFLPLIFRIVSYADEVTIGLETRGYDPDAPRSLSQPLRWQLRDLWFGLGCGWLLTIVYTLAYLEK